VVYPWPFHFSDPVLSVALDIAMDYLEYTGQAEDYRNVETLTVTAILEEYRLGTRHRIALANKAIVVVEKRQKIYGDLASLYPRVC
jgi:hypothetical protein